MSSIASIEKKRTGVKIIMLDDEEVKNTPEKGPTRILGLFYKFSPSTKSIRFAFQSISQL